MKLLELILAFLAQILWPCVTLLLIGGGMLFFRRELHSLLCGRVRAKYGRIEVSFDPDNVAEYETAADTPVIDSNLNVVQQNSATPTLEATKSITLSNQEVATVEECIFDYERIQLP